MRSTASSPNTLGMIDTRKSIGRPSIAILKRPSCGTRRSAMSSSDMTLMREMTCSRDLDAGDRRDLHQHAVDAVADHEPGAHGLEVNVAGAGPQRVVHGRVHELDDRARVLADRRQRQVLERILAAPDAAAAPSTRWSIARSRLLMARDVGARCRARGAIAHSSDAGTRASSQGRSVRIERIADDRQQPASPSRTRTQPRRALPPTAAGRRPASSALQLGARRSRR